jgi:hypothetical protein
MTTTRKQNNTGRTVAVVGSGALLLWLLWHGKGWGGDGVGRRARGGAVTRQPDASPPASPPPPEVRVSIRSGDRVELDGVSSDLATTVARARAAGVARVIATGDARVGWIANVIGALKAASVTVYASSSVLSSAAYSDTSTEVSR